MEFIIIILVFAILVYAMSTSRAQERKKVELNEILNEIRQGIGT